MKLLITTVVSLLTNLVGAIQVPVAWGEPINIEQQPIILRSKIVELNPSNPVGNIKLPQLNNKQEYLPLPSSPSSYSDTYAQQLQSLNIKPAQIEALQKKYLGKNGEKYRNYYLEKTRKEEEGKKDAAKKLYLIKSGQLKPSNAQEYPHISDSRRKSNYLLQIPKEPLVLPLNNAGSQANHLTNYKESTNQNLIKNFRDDKTPLIFPLNKVRQNDDITQNNRNIPGTNNYEIAETVQDNFKELRHEYLPETRQQIHDVLNKNYRDDKIHEPDALDPHLEALTLAKGGKEYRDDETHEPEDNKDTEKLDYIEEETVEEETDENEESNQEEPPQSELEVGRNVPTRPIYPGEGKWAKPGVKHRPYIHIPITAPIQENQEVEDEKRPDGIDIFEDLERYFNSQREKFDQGLQQTSQAAQQASVLEVRNEDIPWLNNDFGRHFAVFDPSRHQQQAASSYAQAGPFVVFNPFEEKEFESTRQVNVAVPRMLYIIPQSNKIQKRVDQEPTPKLKQSQFQIPLKQEPEASGTEETENNEEDLEEEGGEEFVPIRLYTQVRKTEDEEHLPPDPTDERLREVIKDSKVQTVYSEEGYEDSAYDHEGEEKHAEHDEGSAAHEKEISVKKPSKGGKSKKHSFSEDSDSEGSQVVPTKTTLQHEQEPTQMTHNNFIKMKQTKTMAVKDKGDGMMQMEISSEVKVISQPNNSSTAQKFVKVYPKVTQDIENAQIVGNKTNSKEMIKGNIDHFKNSSNSQNQTKEGLPLKEKANLKNTMTTVQPETLEIPKLPKTEMKPLEHVNSEVNKKRLKRFTNDFLKIEIDTDFIEKINHTLPSEKNAEITTQKYPYYQRTDINENSPLRYAETFENIPLKVAGELSFYQQAETNHGCPDIPQGVDPIPERVKNGNQGVDKPEKEDDATPKTPRLKNLGDKIDCLKIKYFGENPLDSPFFKEELVGPVKPIFRGLGDAYVEPSNDNIRPSLPKAKIKDSMAEESKVSNESVEHNEIFNKLKENKTAIINENKKDVLLKQHENKKPVPLEKKKVKAPNNDQVLAVNILSDVIGHIKDNPKKISANHMEPSPDTTTSTSKPLVSFLTTPKYTLNLKPKHIYDQIKLLDHLPPNKENRTDRSDQADEIYYVEDVISKSEVANKRQGRILVDTTPEIQPQNEALRWQKQRTRRPLRSYHKINRYSFSTTTSVPLINTKSTTVLPKYKVVSEVFYKDDIKPNEQLNVFADVLNNIKNSPREEHVQQNLQPKVSADIPVSRLKKTRVKKFQEESSYNINSFNTPATEIIQNTEQYFQTNIPDSFVPSNLYEKPVHTRKNFRKRKPTKIPLVTSTTIRNTSPTDNFGTLPIPQNIIASTEIIGLVPPANWEYKTIVEPILEFVTPVTQGTEQSQPLEQLQEKGETIPLNKYIVPGMRPPPAEEPYIYSDFLLKNNNVLRRRSSITGHKRIRRSPSRPSYSEFSRNRGEQNAEQERTTAKVEEDDYVPHRPKNYYYDEETGRIVYLKRPEVPVAEQEEDGEVEYVEVVEEPPRPQKEKATTKPLLATATPPPAGQSFIDFVVKLKNNENYKFIPDPTTTEKGEVVATSQQVASVVKAEPTAPPEFLNILAKVKSDDSYKTIKDPEEEIQTKKPRITTEAIEIDAEEEESEETHENVQNSPGGQSSPDDESKTKLQIFDISDFLPKIRNYSPKTSIDYSKYKTIERPTTRHSLSSRYNVDENENLDEVVTVRKPIILEKESQPATDDEGVLEENVPTLVSVAPTEALPTRVTTNPGGRRRRPVTLRSNRRTMSVAITSETPQTESTHHVEEQVQPHHDKAKRVYRRRPVRIRSTTVKFLDEYDGDSTKVVRKRSEPDTSVIGEYEKDGEEEGENPNRRQNQNNSADGNKKQASIPAAETSTKRPLVVRIDKTRKPGGHFKLEPDSDKTSYKENPKQSSVLLFKKFDKTKKHGGNYRKEDESETLVLEEIKKEDEIEKEIPEETVKETQTTNNSNVEVFKEFDVTKKHGGNYKASTEAATGDIIGAESTAGLEPSKAKENLSTSKRIGSRRINQNFLDRKREINTAIRNNQNDSEKEDGGKKNISFGENGSKPRRRIRVKPNRNIVKTQNIIPVKRLSDIVPKPDGFYTDPKLPKQVNQLRDTKISSEEVRDIVENVEKKEKIENESKIVRISQTTQKPVFIKDPGKRLYFYAPV